MKNIPFNTEKIKNVQCSECKHRKPKSSSDCAIYKAVFVNQSSIALENMDKLFDHQKGCKSFERRTDDGK